MADDSITFSTALDNKQLEQDLKQAQREVESLRKKVEKASAKRSGIEQELDQAAEAARRASEATEELRAKIDQLRATDPTDEARWHAAQGSIQQLTQQLEAAEKKELQLAENSYKIDERWQAANDEVKQHQAELSGAIQRQSELGAEYQRSYSAAGTAISRSVDTASSAFDRLGARITTMIRRVFMLQVAMSALRGVRSMLSEALMKNQQLSASVEGLKASFQGVVNAVANAVAPAIIGMVNSAIAAIATLARVIDSIFGTHLMASIQQARAAAQATWQQAQASEAAAGAARDQAKATKAAGKAAEKAAKSVMGFDELNQLQENNDSGSGGGGGGGGAPGGGLAPDWDALDVGKIDEKLAEIMLMLGAALMAVGALLAFSGINIPLGLTLMAIGALMVYTAYREKWDELPQKLRDTISQALVITGIVAVVLGAVLAFSGINIPLGIGLMAAGLVLMGISAALNWGRLGDSLKTAITTMLTVTGIVALVLGAVLAFSGVNIPLGLGLLALGALSFGIAGVLNWEALSGDLRKTVSNALELVGMVAVVIGAVLAFTGTNIPLGIGLMGAGIIAVASSVALNWNELSANLTAVVSKALELIGIVAVVIGAVLAFTSVNVPLGIALMAAGAGAMFTAAALNWDELKDKVTTVLSTMLKLAGLMALAVGAIIALSGVNLPLGIALIAAGALALVASAALNWDMLPQIIKNNIGVIAAVASAALLVLGIILCLSGFGIPVGVALILAGSTGLVTAAKLNWNFFADKAKEIWNNIARWFNNTVKPKFTAEFWHNLFWGIVRGIQSAINDAMRAFSEFISWLTLQQSFATGLVSGVVGGLSAHISSTLSKIDVKIPQIRIPHLAAGAVLPPNREFMAVLGDQTRGNNIETPESLMRQVVREEAGSLVADAIRAMATAGGSGGDVVLMVDSRELARATARGQSVLIETGELAFT